MISKGGNLYVWLGFTGITVDFSYCTDFFVPGKLPDIGSALGKSMREFKQAVNTVETETKKLDREVTAAADLKAADSEGK